LNHALKTPANLEIETPSGRVAGGSQYWYESEWRRKAGCGPTAASNLIWYLSRSRPGFAGLPCAKEDTRESFRQLQDEMFTFVTPGMAGVNTSGIFTGGLLGYADAHGLALAPLALDIRQFGRPTVQEALAFIAQGLDCDCPVAFLNLSNGNQQQLDSWHWVTITGLDGATARINDQSRVIRVDIGEWIGSTMLGGAFVYIQQV
jgi:hypothetical protein